jgi:hypothetical protein
MITSIPRIMRGLPVLSLEQAEADGYESITTAVHREREPELIDSLAKGRDPLRTCWIELTCESYELARLKLDLIPNGFRSSQECGARNAEPFERRVRKAEGGMEDTDASDL